MIQGRPRGLPCSRATAPRLAAASCVQIAWVFGVLGRRERRSRCARGLLRIALQGVAAFTLWQRSLRSTPSSRKRLVRPFASGAPDLPPLPPAHRDRPRYAPPPPPPDRERRLGGSCTSTTRSRTTPRMSRHLRRPIANDPARSARLPRAFRVDCTTPGHPSRRRALPSRIVTALALQRVGRRCPRAKVSRSHPPGDTP